MFENPSLAAGEIVVLGAGLVGTELAIYLKGLSDCSVEVVEMLGDINSPGNMCQKNAILDMIIQKNIAVHFNTKVVEITAEGLKCTGPDGDMFIYSRYNYPCCRYASAAG